AQDYRNNGTVNGKGEPIAPNPRFFEAIKKTGDGIAIKGDKDTPYSVMHIVLDNLQTLKLNKFSLMTALKSENE
ncbi:MAG: hypothetical protein K2F58_04980, partial [Muribaculaceae bacterium]|nr:hypothetical protein [Muribaculaceae bacterium]